MSMPMPTTTRTAIHVALIDDQGQTFSHVTSALDAQEHIVFAQFGRINDFANALLPTCDICIVDVYFDNDNELNTILDIIDHKWPLAKTIILSNYADFVAPNLLDRAQACIAKPDFMLRPSVLRSEVITAIRASFDMDDDIKTRAIDALLASEQSNERFANTISEIRLGRIAYPLREQTNVFHENGTYSVTPLASILVGTGDTLASAQTSFARRFHFEYQRLRWKMDLSPEDNKLWSSLQGLVDADLFDQTRTVVVPWEIGCLRGVDVDSGLRVSWYGGRHHEEENTIVIETAPSSIVCLNPGEWFRCTVERQAINRKLVAILEASAIQNPTQTAAQRRKFVSNMHGTWETNND